MNPSPLKIFISYGHEIDVKDSQSGELLYPIPNNENIIRKMTDYLRDRGHSIWLDNVRIEDFTDWRLEITKGILECDVALICLTPKAMKPGGVCRDENRYSRSSKR